MFTVIAVLAILAAGAIGAYLIIRRNTSSSPLTFAPPVFSPVVTLPPAPRQQRITEPELPAVFAPAPVAATTPAPAPQAASKAEKPKKREPRPLTAAQQAAQKFFDAFIHALAAAFDGRETMEFGDFGDVGGCGLEHNNCQMQAKGFIAVAGKVVGLCFVAEQAVREARKHSRNAPFVYATAELATAALKTSEKQQAEQAARAERIEAFRVLFADPDQADHVEVPEGAQAKAWYIIDLLVPVRDQKHSLVLVKGMTGEMLTAYNKAGKPFGRFYLNLGEANEQAAYLRHKPRGVNRPKRIDETAPVEKYERTAEEAAQHAANMTAYAAHKTKLRSDTAAYKAKFDAANPRKQGGGNQKGGKKGQQKGKAARA